MTDTVPPIPCQSSDCLPGESTGRVRELANEFNRSCFCITLDREAMATAMQAAAVVPDFYTTHIVSRPHLFANVPVFLPEADRDASHSTEEPLSSTGTHSVRSKRLSTCGRRSCRSHGPPAPAVTTRVLC